MGIKNPPELRNRLLRELKGAAGKLRLTIFRLKNTSRITHAYRGAEGLLDEKLLLRLANASTEKASD
jgi:hypothetical protein